MTQPVTLSTRDGVATITVDNPPVNALSPGVPEGILTALETAERDASVRAIVLICAGRTFISGADIKELEEAARNPAAAPDLHPLLTRIEDCAKPVIMAIHGMALGGGLEVAMAGHYRVAVADASLGTPEVNLGIIPGAEGTQRLPRLVGVAAAVEMCVSGRPIKAPQALSMGLIDRVVTSINDGDLLSGALSFARDVAGERVLKTREKNDKLGTASENAAIFAAGRAQAGKIRRNQTAPLAALEALEAATTLPFEQGCKKEREIVGRVLASDQAKALIHAFFAERAVAEFPESPRTPRRIRCATSASSARAPWAAASRWLARTLESPCCSKTPNRRRLTAAWRAIRKNYENSVKKGRFSQAVMDQRMALIHPQLDLRWLR